MVPASLPSLKRNAGIAKPFRAGRTWSRSRDRRRGLLLHPRWQPPVAPVALTVLFAGAMAGVLAAVALNRIIASLLFGVLGTDVATFASAVLLLLAVALVAAYVPARRAARTDPVESLRME